MSKQVGHYDGGYQNYDYSNDYSYNQGQEVQATIGYIEVIEDNQMSSYEQSWRTHDRNRQTGSCTTSSTKAVASRGETFKERSTGRVGAKDEFKTTSTYRVGDKSGYTEYQCQERLRRIIKM
ncbi:hypothetical protein Csa_021323 [Cucumis sativus]|uniref:Uncharacterized protein n=1 Tax=Cucumis sativus TaxID=3659 RepID=A0A0A0LK69_CUCSA|nr:hypothetical protein Csa_021323 [Cucumis sativus]